MPERYDLNGRVKGPNVPQEDYNGRLEIDYVAPSAAARGMVRARALENYKQRFTDDGGDEKKAAVLRRIQQIELDQEQMVTRARAEPIEPEVYGPLGYPKHVHKSMKERRANKAKMKFAMSTSATEKEALDQDTLRRLALENREDEEKVRDRGRKFMRAKKKERLAKKKMDEQKKMLLLKRQLLIQSHEHLKTTSRPYSGRAQSAMARSSSPVRSPTSRNQSQTQFQQTWRPRSEYRMPTKRECAEDRSLDLSIFTQPRARPSTSVPGKKKNREVLSASWAAKSPTPSWGAAHGLLQREAWEASPKFCHAPANGYHYTPGYGYGYAPRA
jgi:hypothetical protein